MTLKKNRKGSAIITVVIYFSALMIISVGVLALVNMSTVMRHRESLRQFALYSSESGLDRVEFTIRDRILNTSNNPTTGGIYIRSVTNSTNQINLEAEILRELLRLKKNLLISGLATNTNFMSQNANVNTQVLAALTNAFNAAVVSIDDLPDLLNRYVDTFAPLGLGTPTLAEVSTTFTGMLDSNNIFDLSGANFQLANEADFERFCRNPIDLDQTQVLADIEALYNASFDRLVNTFIRNNLFVANNTLQTNIGITTPDPNMNIRINTATLPAAGLDATGSPIMVANSVTLPFVSTYRTSDTLNAFDREITAIFQIVRPPFVMPHVEDVTEMVTIPNNILYSKALSSQSNINLRGGATAADQANIAGSIYGRTGINFEGFVNITRSTSNAVVENSVLTNGDIQNTGASNLTINSPLTCAQDLITANPDATLAINTNLVLSGDLEMNALRSNVTIRGNYFGFGTGGVSHDNSSSININTADINSTSSLTMAVDDLLIGGTSYVDLPPGSDPLNLLINTGGLYQTGESVSVIGNYITYSFPIMDPASDYSFENVVFEDFPPLRAVHRFLAGTPQPLLTAPEKAAYFVEANEEYEDLLTANLVTGPLTERNNINVTSTSIPLTLGAYINAGGIEGALPLQFSSIMPAAVTASNTWTSRLNTLCSNIAGVADSYNGNVVLNTTGAVNGLGNLGNFALYQARFNRYINDGMIIYADGGTANVTIQTGSTPGITGDAINRVITIRGTNAPIVLVTGGSVTVGAGLNLVGSIVAEGDITFTGNSRITASRDAVIPLLIIDQYDSNNAAVASVASVFNNEGTPITQDFKEGSLANSVLMTRNFNAVTLTRWSRTQPATN